VASLEALPETPSSTTSSSRLPAPATSHVHPARPVAAHLLSWWAAPPCCYRHTCRARSCCLSSAISARWSRSCPSAVTPPALLRSTVM
jgi:hypothetical protein